MDKRAIVYCFSREKFLANESVFEIGSFVTNSRLLLPASDVEHVVGMLLQHLYRDGEKQNTPALSLMVTKKG